MDAGSGRMLMGKPKIRAVDENSANDMASFPPDGYEMPRRHFTCFECKYEKRCAFAYDWYNLHGDCLEMK